MNTEKDLKAFYRSTFDEVHASENLLGKVKDMKNENEMNRTGKTLSRGAIAAAAFAVLMLTNVISYAASGRPWILTITLPDGETRQVEVERNAEDGQLFDYNYEDASAESEHMDSAEADVALETSDVEAAHRLEEKDGRIWLVLDENSRVDITEDFRDGTCKGSLDADGMIWYYEVSGTLEDYQIDAQIITMVTKIG